MGLVTIGGLPLGRLVGNEVPVLRPPASRSSAKVSPRAASALSVAVFLFYPSLALAQTASQITPPSVRPVVPVDSRGITISAASGAQAPEGAERLSVRLAGVELTDGDLADADVVAARRALVAALTDKTVTVADIFKVARDLEAAYGKAGYVLTRVLVPAQQLKTGGRLKLVVIDGFVERIDTAAVPSAISARVQAILALIVGRKGLKSAEIERALLQAGDLPGTQLKSALTRGPTEGGSVLMIQAQHAPVTGSISADNAVGSSLRSITSTVALQANSVFGFGEYFYVQFAGYPRLGGDRGYLNSKPTNRQIGAGAILPLGDNGLTLNFEAIRTAAAPDPSAGQGFYSEFEKYSLRLKYPFVRSRVFNLTGELAFDAEEEALSTLTPSEAAVSLDRLRVLCNTTEAWGAMPWGAFLGGRIVASLGLDALGARNADEATALLPLSR
jgi:hemolysin activation/secretion protein